MNNQRHNPLGAMLGVLFGASLGGIPKQSIAPGHDVRGKHGKGKSTGKRMKNGEFLTRFEDDIRSAPRLGIHQAPWRRGISRAEHTPQQYKRARLTRRERQAAGR